MTIFWQLVLALVIFSPVFVFIAVYLVERDRQ
jgi:hypothetical protein